MRWFVPSTLLSISLAAALPACSPPASPSRELDAPPTSGFRETSSGAFEFRGRGLGLTVDDRGASAPGTGLVVRATALLAPGVVEEFAPVAPVASGDRVVFGRPLVDEWFAAAGGFEHGVTILQPPSRTPGAVAVEVDFGDAVATVDEGGVALVDGASRWRYDGLSVIDATGATLPAWYEAAGPSAVRLAFDPTDATFPVVVDPYLTTATWTLTVSGYAGYSLSVANLNADAFSDIQLGNPSPIASAAKFHRAMGSASGPGAVATISNGTTGFLQGRALDVGRVNDAVANDTIKTVARAINGTSNTTVSLYLNGGSAATTTFTSPDADSDFGWAAAFVDFDGDGDDDLVVGAPKAKNALNWVVGKAYGYRNSAGSFGATPTPVVTWTGTVLGGRYGETIVGIPDADGDGDEEVAIAAPYATPSLTSPLNGGTVYVYKGGSPTPTNVYSSEFGGCGDNSRFGGALLGADLDANGRGDLAIGCPAARSGDGEVKVRLALPDGTFTLQSGYAWNVTTPCSGCAFGTSLAVIPDHDADGKPQLVAGAPQNLSGRGSIYVLKNAAPTTLGSLVQFDGAVVNGRLGLAVEGGDVNGDAYPDLIGGWNTGDTSGGAVIFAGYVDKDGDGAVVGGDGVTNQDCDDLNKYVSPTAIEVVGDQFDQNCDGKELCHVDDDKDGYGVPTGTVLSADVDCTDLGEIVAGGKLDDCDDGNGGVSPGTREQCDASNVDEDCDGRADNADSSSDPATRTLFYADLDFDGYGDPMNAGAYCDIPGVDWTLEGMATDCDDNVGGTNPGALEICDVPNTDQDCNGLADDADPGVSANVGGDFYYPDADGDGHGSIAVSPTLYCDPAPNRVTTSPDDCDDANAAVNPAAQEACDAADVDEDCDNAADDLDTSTGPAGKTAYWPDTDHDGHGDETSASAGRCDWAFGFALVADDCDDTNGEISPSDPELCDDLNTDEDCDGLSDNADPSASALIRWYPDVDQDGFGDLTTQVYACDLAGGTLDASDCNDADASIKPGVAEVCDPANVDENCNFRADDGDSTVDPSSFVTYYSDTDGDGYRGTNLGATNCEGPGPWAELVNEDCNEGDATIHMDAAESCDGVDEDCDGRIDDDAVDGLFSSYADLDGDSFGAGSLEQSCKSGGIQNDDDCDDATTGVNPDAADVCNGIDDDCTGGADDDPAAHVVFYADTDGDGFGDAGHTAEGCESPQPTGWVDAAGDCDDDDANVHAGAPEVPGDGIDNDCDGSDGNVDPRDTDSGTDTAPSAETGTTDEKKCGCVGGGDSRSVGLAALLLALAIRRRR